jgi:hypothetical protein
MDRRRNPSLIQDALLDVRIGRSTGQLDTQPPILTNSGCPANQDRRSDRKRESLLENIASD